MTSIFLDTLGVFPILTSFYIFKSNYKIIDIVASTMAIIFLRTTFLFSSETFRMVLVFFILLFSFYFSEKSPLKAGIFSTLPFINDEVARLLSSNIITINPNLLMRSFILNTVITVLIVILISLIEKKLLYFIQKKIPKMTIFIMIISLLAFFQLVKRIYLIELTTSTQDTFINTVMNQVFFALFFFLMVIVLIAQRSESMRLEAESKKAIFENQLAYLKTIEKNAEEVRKFKHDYQNILLSMDTYFQEDKFDELKNYYYTQIKNSSESLNSTNTQLSKLTKIQNMALRSIFYVKLSIIESEKVNLILEVDKNFYVEEKDEIPLVRALGIILDNAVDALGELDHGELQIAVFENDGSNVVIVKNSCPEDLPPLYQLEEKGYSTKGPNRGIGLSNLQEIMEESDFLLETEIVDHYFIQKIVF